MARDFGVLPMIYTNEDEGSDSGGGEADLLSQGNSPSPLRSKLRLLPCPKTSNHGRILFSAVGVISLTLCTVALVVHAYRQQPDNSQQPHKHLVASLRSSREAVLLPPACDYTKVSYCPGYALFHNSDIQSVALVNLVKTSNKQIGRNDIPMAQGIIASVFHNISIKFRQLEQLQINTAEKDGMVKVLSLMRAPNVQNLGQQVTKMIHKAPNVDRTWLKWYIEDQLSASAIDISFQAKQLVPDPVLELWKMFRNEFNMVLNPQNILSLRANDFDEVSTDEPRPDPEIMFFGIYANALEQAHVLWNLLLTDPAKSTSMEQEENLIHEGIDWPTDSESLKYIGSMRWPMTLGMHGIDVLRTIYTSTHAKELEYVPGQLA